MARVKKPLDVQFTEFLKKYPHSPGYKSKFSSLLRQHVHGETRDIGLLLLAWKQGISEEIGASSLLSDSFVHRFVRKMSTGTGTSREWCEWATRMWCVCYGANTLHKNCDVELDLGTVEGPASLAEEEIGLAAGEDAASLFEYSTHGGTREITGYKGKVGRTVLVPAEHDGMPVRKIGPGAFYRCDAVHVVMPDSIQEIGEDAFADSANLQQAVLPRALQSIGERAFMNCRRLRAVELPEEVQYIGTEAFSGTGLHRTQIPDTVTQLGEAVFEECRELIEAEVGLGIIELPARTFRDCTALEDVTFPVTLERIGPRAFEGCTSLPDMQLPDGVKYVGEDAFARTHPQFRLVGRRGSVVEYYCKTHNMRCVLVR